MGQRAHQSTTSHTALMSHAALLAGGFIGMSAIHAVVAPSAIASRLDTRSAIAQPSSSGSHTLGDRLTDESAPTTGLLAPAQSISTPEKLTVVPSPSASLEGYDKAAGDSIDLSTVSPEFSVTGDRPQNFGSTYIDTTEYSLGATQAPSVILTERSTGCSTVLEQGQVVSNSICGPSDSPLAYSEGQSPNLPAVNSVRVGPLSVGPNGIRLVRSLNINDYYNRTARPQAFAGNGDRQLMFPVSAPAMISSPFGWRVHPIFGSVRMHTGTDIAAPAGTPVLATYSGRVTVADFLGGYGLTVVLRHDDRTIETLYGHLSEIFVRPGAVVEQGEVIGRVGSTGNSTGPHLHFELRQPTANGWVAVNSGDLLQSALGLVQNGLQLATTEEDKPTSLMALNVPEFLLSGKDATKDAPGLISSGQEGRGKREE